MNSYSSSSFTRRMNSTVSKYISSWITPYFSIRFLTFWLSAYSRLILNLTCSNTSTIPASSIAESAVFRYALESPPKTQFYSSKIPGNNYNCIQDFFWFEYFKNRLSRTASRFPIIVILESKKSFFLLQNRQKHYGLHPSVTLLSFLWKLCLIFTFYRPSITYEQGIFEFLLSLAAMFNSFVIFQYFILKLLSFFLNKGFTSLRFLNGGILGHI